MRFDTLTLRTSDGLTLHGDLVLPDSPRGAAVVCHPHPLYGGDRFNPVVTAVMEACNDSGLASIRFDFRGVNQSEGTHGNGVDEQLDALAALEAVMAYAGGGPVLMAGYSFGSVVALNVVDLRITAWLGVAPPLAMMGADAGASADPRPKHLLVPEHDQYSPPAATAEKSASWTSTTSEVVGMADHFMAGLTPRVRDLAAEFVSALAAR